MDFSMPNLEDCPLQQYIEWLDMYSRHVDDIILVYNPKKYKLTEIDLGI